MADFISDGVRISFLDQAPDGGPTREHPVLLIHGFASSVAMNWLNTSWVEALVRDGYRVVAFDNRGHGASEKLFSIEDYGAPLMARDAANLLAHLGIARAHVIGYSMGARISAFLSLAVPARVRSVVFGGLGINMVLGLKDTSDIADALDAPSLAHVTTPSGRTFRAFAEQTKSNLKALSACIKSAREPITREALSGLQVPALIAVGENDTVGGSAEALQAIIPGSRAFIIPGREHMKAVGDRAFKAEALAFIAEHD